MSPRGLEAPGVQAEWTGVPGGSGEARMAGIRGSAKQGSLPMCDSGSSPGEEA